MFSFVGGMKIPFWAKKSAREKKNLQGNFSASLCTKPERLLKARKAFSLMRNADKWGCNCVNTPEISCESENLMSSQSGL